MKRPILAVHTTCTGIDGIQERNALGWSRFGPQSSTWRGNPQRSLNCTRGFAVQQFPAIAFSTQKHATARPSLRNRATSRTGTWTKQPSSTPATLTLSASCLCVQTTSRGALGPNRLDAVASALAHAAMCASLSNTAQLMRVPPPRSTSSGSRVSSMGRE